MMAAITTATMMIHIVVRRFVTETMFTTFESRHTRAGLKLCGEVPGLTDRGRYAGPSRSILRHIRARPFIVPCRWLRGSAARLRYRSRTSARAGELPVAYLVDAQYGRLEAFP